MVRPVVVLLLAVLGFSSGFESTVSEIEFMDNGGTEENSSDCGSILKAMQMSQKQLDRLEGIVQSLTPNLRETIELKFYKLLEKVEHVIESKFEALDKKIDTKFHETKTYIDSKFTVTDDKISEYTSHVDSKLKGLKSTLTHALNASDTFNNNNTCCKLCLETAAFVKNTTADIKDMNIRALNITVTLQEMNEAIHNLTDFFVPSIIENIPKQNDTTESTEPAHNVSDIITTTEVNKPASSKCYLSQQEQCCTAAASGRLSYVQYIDMSSRGRHTELTMTRAGLQEYTMYFALIGDWMQLLLSPTSSYVDYMYTIEFITGNGGHITVYEKLPNVAVRCVHNFDTPNIISREKYIYHYVTISGDTLKVGKRGESPFLTHNSTELSRLRYLTFARGLDNGAALYDCTAE